MPEDLDDRIDALCQAWSGDPDLAAIYLFGGRAGGREGPRRADVDLAVVLREDLDADARGRKRLTLLGDACRRLGTEVNLVILEDAPAPLGHRVLTEGRLLRDALPHRRVEVAERVLRHYLDEAPLRHLLDAGLAERLRQKRFAP